MSPEQAQDPVPTEGASDRDDIVYQNSRRETLTILIAFVVFLGWSLSVSYWMGYARMQPGDFATSGPPHVFGVPTWVFWGVVVPWCVAVLFTIWFCLAYMIDDDLSGSDQVASLSADAAADRKE